MKIHDHERLTAGFFRGVNSPELFKAFFDGYGVWRELKLKEKPTNDEIYASWTELEDSKKKEEIQEALCQMNDLAREDAREWLYTVAEEAKLADYGKLTLHKITMTLFLYYSRAFSRAYECFSVEKLDNLKIYIGEPAAYVPSDADMAQFCEKLRIALKRSAQGPNLMVEPGPVVEGKRVLVIPHENYVKPDHEFGKDNSIITRDRRPVYELVIIYYPEHGILKLKSGKGKRKAEMVSALFASELLKKPANHFHAEDIVSFDPLFQLGFNFPKEPDDQFEWAVPSFIDFKPRARSSLRQTITIDSMRGGKLSVLDQLAEQSFSLANIEIKGLGIHFRFPGDGRRAHRTVMLTPPNHYNLDETPRSRHLEEVLIRWGFLNVRAKKAHELAVVAR